MRLLRESTYCRLIDRIDGLERERVGQETEIRGLLRAHTVTCERYLTQLVEAEASKRAAFAMRDGLITRLNVLEEEAAQLRHKMTGLPQIAPQIARGTPLQSETLGAGLDVFEDVGDEEAVRLRSQGILHDEPSPVLAGARELIGSF